ncbi:hypothetical protein ACFQY0_11755 [Haloferula chungangensis]|uniref:Uncharacterized protein n=1 Tax=Haloferula chungangensis TaxID=1048331 RepID=A0ABW2L8G8_9BACT
MSATDQPQPEWPPGPLWILRVATVFLFAARGFLYLTNHGPLSVFFWNQDWLEVGVFRFLGLDWETYAANSEVVILSTQKSMGWLFISAAAVACFVSPTRNRWASGVVLGGAVFLIPYWLLAWVETDYRLPMFLEHFLQWMTPLLLVGYGRLPRMLWCGLAWLAVSCTFVGHGHYAIGLGVPVTNDYINLCIAILHCNADTAKTLLAWVGWVDLALPVLILLPWLRVPALGYMALWGVMTAIARIVGHWTPAEDYYGLHPWLAEAIVRLPHGLVPLTLLVLLVASRKSVKGWKKIRVWKNPRKADECGPVGSRTAG